jgi:hypothetical protein
LHDGLRVASSSTESRDDNQCSNAMAGRAKQHNDDLEDRAIGAAGIHGFYPKRAYEGGEVTELKGLSDTDYRTIVLDLRDVRLAMDG